MTAYNSARGSKRNGGVIFFLFALGVVLTLGLYFVKTRAQTAKSQAVKLERQVKAQEAEIFKLKSELAFLESPARIERLAGEILGLEKTSVDRVIGLADIEEHFPVEKKDGDDQ